jgi:hypothetical protein
VSSEAATTDSVPTPAAEGQALEQRWVRAVDTVIVVILAVASLLAAWGGYQASLWSGDQTASITRAEEKQIDATRATTIGYQVMQIDIALFLNWLNAFKDNKPDLAEFYVERFSPQLQPAFTAWMATDPLSSPDAPADPFRMAEYQVPQLLEAAELDAEAHHAFADAERVGAISDAYVLSTLLLAVVLFFAGVCTKIGWRPAQLALLVIAILLLLYSVQKLGALADGSDWVLTPLWGELDLDS